MLWDQYGEPSRISLTVMMYNAFWDTDRLKMTKTKIFFRIFFFFLQRADILTIV